MVSTGPIALIGAPTRPDELPPIIVSGDAENIVIAMNRTRVTVAKKMMLDMTTALG